jgi:SAM-dependent methyltransferase
VVTTLRDSRPGWSVLRRTLGRSLYQDKRAEGNEQRWEIIRAQLGAEDGSLLDVGCNAGLLTRRAAERGLVALGCDIMPAAVARATRIHRGTPGLAFMQLEITPQTIARLPSFDVVLCLSVHHYWVKAFGEAAAWDMMRTLVGKARRKLFFEPASRHTKYKPVVPDFVELDRGSIERYNTERLRAAAGTEHAVTCLGATSGVGKEVFRVMFLVDKGAAGTGS